MVIPQVVDNEILALKLGNRDKTTKQKATFALKATDEAYSKGEPGSGIEFPNGSWVVTVPSVRESDDDKSIENDQVRKLLGSVDSALLRLAEACIKDVPDIPAVLITRDANLRRVARVRGLRACSLSDLRKPEVLNDLLVTDHPIQPLDLDALLSPDEQPVKVALTLEELRSEGDYLIARGSGSLTWKTDSYPFRWTFPYKNAEKVAWEDWEPDDVMPLENFDFFGKDEQLPEEVRRFVGSILEQSAQEPLAQARLQSPNIRVGRMFAFIIDMEWLGGASGIVGDPPWFVGESPEKLKLWRQYAKHIQPLLKGTVDIDSYMAAFEAFKALEDDQPTGFYDEEPMSGLQALIDSALESWPVGRTLEWEYTYMPFQWDDEEEEADDNEDSDSKEWDSEAIGE